MNYIGIDIGGTNPKAGLVDEDGLLLAVKTMKIREVSDPDALTDTLVAPDPNWPRRAACPWRRSPPWGRASRGGGHPHRVHRVYLQPAPAEHSSAEAVQAAAGAASVCGK